MSEKKLPPDWTPIAKEYDPLKCGSIDGTDDFPHDKGVVRALNSKYKPNKQVQGDPLCTIFVGRLNPDTTENVLLEMFSQYGNIKHMRLVRDIISGFSKRYAFIEYKSGSSAQKAAHRADKTWIDGHQILVDMECEREMKGWIPRRLGGGFGGRKESGQLRFGGKDRPFRKPIVLGQTNFKDHSFRDGHSYNDRKYDYSSHGEPRAYERKREDNSNDRLSRSSFSRDSLDHSSQKDRGRVRHRSRSRSPKRHKRDNSSDSKQMEHKKKSKHKHKSKKHKHGHSHSRSRSR